VNRTDRKRLVRLKRTIESIPFPHDGSGTKTATLEGFLSFQNDIRAVRGAWGKVIEGMLAENVEGLMRGWDYDDPDLLLDALERWVSERQDSNWERAPGYSFDSFYRDVRTKQELDF